MTPETKDIKNYLHLYVGCDCDYPQGTGKLVSISQWTAGVEQDDTEAYYSVSLENVVPHLRRLESMTEDENQEWAETNIHDNWYMDEAEATQYLLSKHFDLFGLIDAGLAVEKK